MQAVFHIKILSDSLHTDSVEYDDATLCRGVQVVSSKWLHNIQFQKTVIFISLAVYSHLYYTYCWGTMWLSSLVLWLWKDL